MEQKKQENVDKEEEIETSLTSPSDRNPNKSNKTRVKRPLTEEEVEHALLSNDDNSFVKNFLKVERKYADPVEPLQQIGLFSFLPAKGAKPNENGIYGFAKLRGNFASDNEASERAEYLIRNVDSVHHIFHTYVGRPFPLTDSLNFSEKINKINIYKSMSESFDEKTKEKEEKEQKQIKDINERRKKLLEEEKEDYKEDPLDFYTTLRVKKAQLTKTYLDTIKNIEHIKNCIINTRKKIHEMDLEDKSYSEKFFDKYKQASEEVGLDISQPDSISHFLFNDTELDF